jgi:hypothetical protein
MRAEEMFFCIGLLVLCGCFHIPAHVNTDEEEKFWRSRRGRSVHVTHGEQRPFGARRVEATSRWPSQAEVTRLVVKYGYCPSAAVAGIYRVGVDDCADDEYNNDFDFGSNKHLVKTLAFHPEHPYIPATPELRGTTQGGGFHAETVARAIAEYLPGISDAHAKAVYEVIVLRRNAVHVAQTLGVSVGTVYQYKWKVTRALRSKGQICL